MTNITTFFLNYTKVDDTSNVEQQKKTKTKNNFHFSKTTDYVTGGKHYWMLSEKVFNYN